MSEGNVIDLERVVPIAEKPCHPDLIRSRSKVSTKLTIGYDDNGDKVYEFERPAFKANGSGFVISYTDKISDLLAKVSTSSVLRIFFYLAHHQQYGSDGVQYGYRCSHKHIEDTLHIDRKSVYNALKYLRENYLVLESRIEGFSEFMVNPAYVTIGNDKRARLKEWSRRWELYFKKTGGKL